MKKWKIQLTVEVSENWVEDGFDLNESEREEQIKEAFANMLPYAYGHEVKVEIISNTCIHRPNKVVKD